MILSSPFLLLGVLLPQKTLNVLTLQVPAMDNLLTNILRGI